VKSTLHQEIIEWIAVSARVSKEKLTPETSLLSDLGIAGDDAEELLQVYGKRFYVDLS
jgi:hypothetical protein